MKDSHKSTGIDSLLRRLNNEFISIMKLFVIGSMIIIGSIILFGQIGSLIIESDVCDIFDYNIKECWILGIKSMALFLCNSITFLIVDLPILFYIGTFIFTIEENPVKKFKMHFIIFFIVHILSANIILPYIGTFDFVEPDHGKKCIGELSREKIVDCSLEGSLNLDVICLIIYIFSGVSYLVGYCFKKFCSNSRVNT